MPFSDSYKEIEAKIWSAFNILRESISGENYYIINLFLMLKRENVLDRINLTTPHIKEDVAQIVRELSKSKLDLISEVFDEFERTIQQLQNHQLRELIDLINSIDSKVLNENFTDLFDFALEQVIKHEGRRSGEYSQPKELTKLMCSFVPEEGNISVYNPFAGLASFALHLPKGADYVGQEINRSTWAIARLRMLAYNCPEEYQYRLEDSIRNWIPNVEERKFDVIISTPPFGVRLRDNETTHLTEQRIAEAFLIEQSIRSLTPNGKAVIVSTYGSLFRGGVEQRLREELITTDKLEMIVSFPGGLFQQTAIPFVLMVLNNNKPSKGEVLIVNAEECLLEESSKTRRLNVDAVLRLIDSNSTNEFRRVVNAEEIIENEFNLIPNRYLIPEIEPKEGFELVMLGDLITISPRESVQAESVVKFIRIRDLADSPIKFEKNFEDVEAVKIPNYASLLPENSLLLAIRWKSLKPTFYTSNAHGVFYSYPDMVACQIDENKVDRDYLIKELNKEYVNLQIDKFRTGTTVSGISRNDLLRVKIQLPSLEKQKEEVTFQQVHEVYNLETKLEKLREEYGLDVADENSFLRHQIAGSLKNVRGAYQKVIKIINEKLDGESDKLMSLKLSESSKYTFGDYLQIIERDLESIHSSIIQTGKQIDFVNLDISEINIIDFVEEYYNDLKTRQGNIFDVKLDVFDRETFAENGINNVLIKGDVNLIRKMFDNIVENAEKHAFDNKASIKNKLEIDLMFDFDDMEIQIDFSNTGKPLPENYSFEDYTRKGSKTGGNSGDGFGGWYINEIMKLHSGKLTFTDETGPEGNNSDLATTIELHFPIEIN